MLALGCNCTGCSWTDAGRPEPGIVSSAISELWAPPSIARAAGSAMLLSASDARLCLCSSPVSSAATLFGLSAYSSVVLLCARFLFGESSRSWMISSALMRHAMLAFSAAFKTAAASSLSLANAVKAALSSVVSGCNGARRRAGSRDVAAHSKTHARSRLNIAKASKYGMRPWLPATRQAEARRRSRNRASRQAVLRPDQSRCRQGENRGQAWT